MKNFAVRLAITNDLNDDKRVEWFFCNSEIEKINWIKQKEEEAVKWNYNTPGAMSRRDYNFDEFPKERLLDCDMKNLEGLTFRQFFFLLKEMELFQELIPEYPIKEGVEY